jgi:sugar phosphate isomerase/epimerase
MVRSAVTVSIVDEARKGPFVFHGDVRIACSTATELGFDGIELFAPSADAVRSLPLAALLKEFGLNLAAVGTGAGMLIRRLTLSDADPNVRRQAIDFIREMIDVGADFGAPAIIGSMQGRWDARTDYETAMSYLRDGLNELGDHAATRGIPLLYEPLNRYESNLTNTLEQGVNLIQSVNADGILLLADLFHMNIEEVSVENALSSCMDRIGHVHFVDSNRQAAGQGHLEFESVSRALKQAGYRKYVSAEAFPVPNSEQAARSTIQTIRRYFSH